LALMEPPLSFRCAPPESGFQESLSFAEIEKTTNCGLLVSFPPGSGRDDDPQTLRRDETIFTQALAAVPVSFD